MNILSFLFLSIFIAIAQTSNQSKLESIRQLRKFALGSCNKQYIKQTVWWDMIFQAPDLFIWGGDSVYVNSKDPDKIRAAYEMQNSVEEYQFLKSLTPIIGTWDDHDYGDNNSNWTFVSKVKSQEHALNFLEEPILSPRRIQEGIYTSYDFGPPEKKVKIILLDNRYFKDQERTAPLLGTKQWNWLEDQLQNSKAALHFIVSGLSVLSPGIPGSEEWRDYPTEFQRLDQLLNKYRTPGVVFLTGDKHFSSVFTRNGKLEFMSSGMTHNTRLPLRPYVRATFPNPLFKRNYGMVEIAWDKLTPKITIYNRTDELTVENLKNFIWNNNTWKEIPASSGVLMSSVE